MRRGEIWWASLQDPQGSGPGYRRPVVIVQSDSFNESRINTVIVAIITSNLILAAAPGNVMIEQRVSMLANDSIVNVPQVLTIDRSLLTEVVSQAARQDYGHYRRRFASSYEPVTSGTNSKEG